MTPENTAEKGSLSTSAKALVKMHPQKEKILALDISIHFKEVRLNLEVKFFIISQSLHTVFYEEADVNSAIQATI